MAKIKRDSSKIKFFTFTDNDGAGRGKVIGTNRSMTMLLYEYEPGEGTPEHSHPHEQLGYCLKGTCELTVEGKTFILKGGYTYSIPPKARHAWRNIGEEIFTGIDIFCPFREDLLGSRFDPKYFVGRARSTAENPER